MIDLAAQLADLRAREEPVERFVLVIDGVLQPAPRAMKISFDPGAPTAPKTSLYGALNLSPPSFQLEVDGVIVELDPLTVNGSTSTNEPEGWNALRITSNAQDGRLFHITIREPIPS